MLPSTALALTLLSLATPLAALPTHNRPTRPVLLHPNGDESRCLSAIGDIQYTALLNFVDCGDKKDPNLWWSVSDGPTLIKAPGWEKCIQAGIGGWDQNYNGTYLYIDDCTGISADKNGNGWTWTFGDNKIYQTGSNQCLSSKPGMRNKPLTVNCEVGSPDQIWTTSS